VLAFFIHVLYVKNNGDILSNFSFSKAYEDNNGKLIQVFLTEDDKYRIYKNISEYPNEFIELLLIQEDKFFYSHNGINLVSIFKAFNETYIKKTRRIGASTITMQVAKLKYNLYTKNIFGKIKQIFLALYLDLCFSKQDILDAYVNLAPCGKNIEGFESASWYYFGKSITELSLSENIMLCVLPQNPTKRSPQKFNTPIELINARKVLFESWVQNHPEDEDKRIYMNMRINTLCEFPNEAIHFTQMLSQNENSKNKIKSRRIKKTTIDLKLQKQCEEFLTSHIQSYKSFGVSNGGLLLLDWQTMEVVANVGSANFYSDEIQGQVNITTSKRSPGSTLKPFIYALALEQGLIHYSTMLKDTPQAFNEYAPDNYGSTFKGPVKAWFALADSRNIPAVSLAQQISNPDLYDFLKQAKISDLKNKEHYGLSIVLGSAEISMLELTKLYAMLANNGVYKNINFYKESFATKDLIDNSPEKKLLNPESAFIVRKMLEANIPPVESIPRELKNIPIGYKTGTSIGFKDSWTVGIFDKYVLCVWIGNFNGQGNNAFLGRRMSAPLFFEIAYSMLSQMDKSKMILVDWKPRKVTQIDVCSVS
jgi:penicillin-binding protein 1C